MIGVPFCDALTVTFPDDYWHQVRQAILPELDAIGMGVEVDVQRLVLWRAPGGAGVVRAEVVNAVRVLSISGAVCGGLRGAGRWGAMLAAIGQFPHRVTRLDATLDVAADAPPILSAVAALARAGGLSMTRKAVRPRDVTSLLSLRDDGELSGTLYVGSRRAGVRLCLYDKRKERMDNGLLDVGPLTRYELRVGSSAGVSLRDAFSPVGLFWHFLPGEVLPCPAGVAPWAPTEGGYDLDRPEPLTPAERLYRRVQDSAELAALVKLASEFPGGLDYLAAQVRRMGAAWGGGVSPPLTAVAESAEPAEA